MRVVIIGGSGHVGTYLVPRLVEAGHEVINISRQQRAPYRKHGAWQAVRQVTLDRTSAELEGDFGGRVAALEGDAIIDMMCFNLASARHLVEAVSGRVQHFLHCGTIWVHGPSVAVPTGEEQPRRPFGEYGIQKAAIEAYLLERTHRDGFPATILHPGHIVGPGWNILNPQGNFNPGIFGKLARGEEVVLPNLGMETVHHVHADDVAQCFAQALTHWSTAVGESFHVVSPAALTLRGYAEAVAGWSGRAANLRYAPWEEFKTAISAEDASATWDHIAHSPNCSIARAERLLEYRPRYTSLQATYEAVEWLTAAGQI